MPPRQRRRPLLNATTHPLSPCDDLIRFWVLRALVLMGGNREFIIPHGYREDNLARFLGLSYGLDVASAEEKVEFEPSAALAEIRAKHEEAESMDEAPAVPENLARNVATLASMLSLNDAECRVLEFAVLLHTVPALADACCMIGLMTTLHLRHTLSVLLRLDETALKLALSPHSALSQTGLVTVDRNSSHANIAHKLDLLSSSFADGMLSDAIEPVDILRDTITRCSPAQLEFADYPHMSRELKVLRPYLRRAVSEGLRGVNILVFGAPGTGKSQLGRVIASDMGLELFEVASEDSDGDPVDASRRLRAQRAAQAILANRKTMLLFDEVEDVFADGNSMFGKKSTAQLHKAWINRMLEENPVPTLWLSNDVQCMDPAFVRRFDMVIELPVPPLAQRRRIVERAAANLLPPAAIERIASAEHLAPAIISRAMSVVQRIQDDLPPDQIPGAVEWMVSTTLEAQGHPALKKHNALSLPDFYDPAFINSGDDLARIAEGLKHTRSGRLCLYGPPGTGKTAFGRWLAEQLDIPLSVKRASDIMSMWVGGTEKNLARAFREAETDGALLLIDEVDSFLQDRRTARQSWEVSGVNEMLTQMEAFGGVFIASTNLVAGLDQAALRRFDLKLKFDFLLHDQAWLLFGQQCRAIGLNEPDTALHARINKLTRLTPGDFAAAARQHRFRPFNTPLELLCALEDECALKEGGVRTAIGFL